MTKYGMFLKNGKDLIHSTHQETLEIATKYFAGVKQMSTKKFKNIFIVTEIKK
tara:strand:+ start:381 stop:539 length:159 start_codon:yes stop_codon:yes gene_type:complete